MTVVNTNNLQSQQGSFILDIEKNKTLSLPLEVVRKS